MLKYKNIGCSAKTFYGVTFEPDEIKEVPGYINNPNMVRVFQAVKQTSAKKRPYNKKPNKVETQPAVSPSTETTNLITTTPIKEETPDG